MAGDLATAYDPVHFWAHTRAHRQSRSHAVAGQNAFFFGALVAWWASLTLAGRTLAGVPLGLLTVKPQFLPGIGLYQYHRMTSLYAALFVLTGGARRRWPARRPPAGTESR